MKIKVEDINDYTDVNYMLFTAEMDPERQQKAFSYAREEDRMLCILADNLAKRMISESYDIYPQMISFYRDANGKPRCLNSFAKFNISHSGTKVACAVSDNEIGIDIEINRSHPSTTIDRFATENEKKYIDKAEENFLKIWVLKEAYVKCTGEGINGNLKNIEFTVNDDDTVICSDERYKAELHNIVEGYTLATVEKIG